MLIFKRNGSIIFVILSLVAVSGFIAFIGQYFYEKNFSTQRRIADLKTSLFSTSAIETVLHAYRLAEATYLKEIFQANCTSAPPFITALAEGSQCPAANNIKVFSGNSAFEAEGALSDLYSYVGSDGCLIRPNASATCLAAGASKIIISIGKGPNSEKQKIDSSIYEIALTSVNPSKGIVEMMLKTSAVDGTVSRNAFAIRTTMANSAHLESDGRVVQQNPHPLAFCRGEPWSNYLFYHNKECYSFVQMGSGTGLAYYKERFFGFRPFDGQVIDLLKATLESQGYLVQESGLLGGEKIFPEYQKTNLINVDDITIIGDQIYFVAFSGTSAQIGYLKKNGNSFERVNVCPLGEMGWSQSYEGIASLSWSDPLEDSRGNAGYRLARFFLKTSLGDYLTALVINDDGSPCEPGTLNCRQQCFVYKEEGFQAVEHKRTLGFDRVAQEKPYYLY